MTGKIKTEIDPLCIRLALHFSYYAFLKSPRAPWSFSLSKWHCTPGSFSCTGYKNVCHQKVPSFRTLQSVQSCPCQAETRMVQSTTDSQVQTTTACSTLLFVPYEIYLHAKYLETWRQIRACSFEYLLSASGHKPILRGFVHTVELLPVVIPCLFVPTLNTRDHDRQNWHTNIIHTPWTQHVESDIVQTKGMKP